MKRILRLLVQFAFLVLLVSTAEATTRVRIGHFPNITHAQAVVAHALSQQGRGWFEQRLGPGVEVQWFVYNAGPSVIEGIFAGSLDLAFIGPSPALNAHFRSRGDEIRVLSGAVNGGAALVVHANSTITAAGDFRGRKIATPQLGNSQDISARAWLRSHGLKTTMTGGDVFIIPTPNPDQLALLQSRRVDAVWTVEPWVTRLEREVNARVLHEDREVITTWLIGRRKFIEANRALCVNVVRANAELTRWMQEHETEALRLLREELKRETRTDFSEELIVQAWRRIRLTPELSPQLIDKAVQDAKAVGFFRGNTDTSKLLARP